MLRVITLALPSQSLERQSVAILSHIPSLGDHLYEVFKGSESLIREGSQSSDTNPIYPAKVHPCSSLPADLLLTSYRRNRTLLSNPTEDKKLFFWPTHATATAVRLKPAGRTHRWRFEGSEYGYMH